MKPDNLQRCKVPIPANESKDKEAVSRALLPQGAFFTAERKKEA